MKFRIPLSVIKKLLIVLGVFIVLIVLAYLPKISHVGYLQEDRNVLFVAEKLGSGLLTFHFSIDRALHGYFCLLEDHLFGTNITAFLASVLV